MTDITARPDLGEVRFYIDCEFDGHGGPLLSFGIVSDSGDGAHIQVVGAPPPRDPWVAENILPILDSHEAPKSFYLYECDVGGALRTFIGDCERPVIVADSPVDIGRFCAALSTGPDGGWMSTGYPLMRFEAHNVDCWPNDLVGGVQHNAWWDAMALRHVLRTARPDALAGKLADFARSLAERDDSIGDDARAALAEYRKATRHD